MDKLKLYLKHKGLEGLINKNDQLSNRIVFTIILSALVIGSSLIVLSGVPPKWNDIPIIGIVMFLAAGFIGFWLLISILRHRKM